MPLTAPTFIRCLPAWCQNFGPISARWTDKGGSPLAAGRANLGHAGNWQPIPSISPAPTKQVTPMLGASSRSREDYCCWRYKIFSRSVREAIFSPLVWGSSPLGPGTDGSARGARGARGGRGLRSPLGPAPGPDHRRDVGGHPSGHPRARARHPRHPRQARRRRKTSARSNGRAARPLPSLASSVAADHPATRARPADPRFRSAGNITRSGTISLRPVRDNRGSTSRDWVHLQGGHGLEDTPESVDTRSVDAGGLADER